MKKLIIGSGLLLTVFLMSASVVLAANEHVVGLKIDTVPSAGSEALVLIAEPFSLSIEALDNEGSAISTDAKLLVSLSDDGNGGIFTTGTVNGVCNETAWNNDSDGVSNGSTRKGFCYKNSTPGVYIITATAGELSTTYEVTVTNILGEITFDPNYMPDGYAHEVLKIIYPRYVEGDVVFTLEDVGTGVVYTETSFHGGVNPAGSFQWSYRDDKGLTGTAEYPTLADVWTSDNTIVPAGTTVLISITLTPSESEPYTITSEYTVTAEDVHDSSHLRLGESNPNFTNTDPVVWSGVTYVHEVFRLPYEFGGSFSDTSMTFKVYADLGEGEDVIARRFNRNPEYGDGEANGGLGEDYKGALEWSFRDERPAFDDEALSGYIQDPDLNAIWAADDTIVPAGTVVKVEVTLDGNGSVYVQSVNYTVTEEDVRHANHNPNDDVPVSYNLDDGDVVLDGESIVTINVSSLLGSNSIDVSGILQFSDTNTATFNGPVTVNSTIDSGTVVLNISQGTTITGSSLWDGKILPPRAVGGSGNAPAGFSVGNTIVSVGSLSETLTFDKAVKLVLPGVSGTVGYKPAGSDTWQTIVTQCNGVDDSSNISSGECYFADGDDMVIWTFHFTEFGGLDPVPPATVVVATPVSGGSSGQFTPAARSAVLASISGNQADGRVLGAAIGPDVAVTQAQILAIKSQLVVIIRQLIEILQAQIVELQQAQN